MTVGREPTTGHRIVDMPPLAPVGHSSITPARSGAAPTIRRVGRVTWNAAEDSFGPEAVDERVPWYDTDWHLDALGTPADRSPQR